MSRPLLVLDARAVFKVKPTGAEHKVSAEPNFCPRFRTVAECTEQVSKWARGQYEDSMGLDVHVMKPEAWAPNWRADVFRRGELLANVVMTPPREKPATKQEGLFP